MPEDTSTQPSQSVTLRPYQQEFVNQVVNSILPARYLLSAPPGAGKAAALGAAVGALKAKRNEVRYIAIVAGATGTHRHPVRVIEDARSIKIHWNYFTLVRERTVRWRRMDAIYYASTESERKIAARIQELIGQNDQTQLVARLLLRRL